MKHFVHVYHVMRSKYEVEADDHRSAIINANGLFSSQGLPLECESAEEINSYLVDVEGDEDYDNSAWYEADGVSPMCNFYYVRCEHADDVTMNYDLFVRASDEADALVLWREYYGEAIADRDHDEPTVRRLNPPIGRGAVPWN